MDLPVGVTADSLLEYWGVSMVAVGVVVALVFATVAIFKKQFGVKGGYNLLVSGGASLVWSLLVLLPMPGVKVVTIIATAVVSFLMASGGWQGLKDALGKVGRPTGAEPLSNPEKR
jgi:hypothetical protein